MSHDEAMCAVRLIGVVALWAVAAVGIGALAAGAYIGVKCFLDVWRAG